MKKYNGPSVRQGCTDTGKIPDSVGCCAKGGGGVIRRLTKREESQQRKLQHA
jgi:hypothetical protein